MIAMGFYQVGFILFKRFITIEHIAKHNSCRSIAITIACVVMVIVLVLELSLWINKSHQACVYKKRHFFVIFLIDTNEPKREYHQVYRLL